MFLDVGQNVLFSVISDTILLISNDVLCSGSQSIGLFFRMFFNSGLNAAAVCANFGIYLVRWCIDPIKRLSCLKVFGGESFSIASVFLIKGVAPSLLIVFPSHSTCLHANLYVHDCPMIWPDFQHLRFPESFEVFVCVYRLTPRSQPICRLNMSRCLSNL